MVAFGDLSTAAGLGKLNEHMQTRSYVEGYSFSDADRSTFAQLGGLPDAGSFPYAYRWGLHIAALTGARGTVAAAPAAAAPAAAKGKGKAAAAKPAAKANDDFGDDLFGDDEEPVEVAPKQSLKERAAALKAKKEQEKIEKIEKSQILFEVKPSDTEIDLNQLFRTITARVVDGLTWGEGYELKPVAYGINKLVMSCVIIDDKVLIDDIFEPIEAMDEEVQSVDMLTMNKV